MTNRLLQITAVLVLTVACDRESAQRAVPTSFSRLPVFHVRSGLPAELANAGFQVVTSTGDLPPELSSALADLLGQRNLLMASAGQPFSDGCNPVGSLPRHRLIAAALNPRFAVIHFEEGGFVVVPQVLVFQRAGSGSQPVLLWRHTTEDRFLQPNHFLAAIKNGLLLSQWPG